VGAESVTNGEILAGRLAFRVTEAAALIGVSAAFVRLELARGNLSATRLGRRVVLTRVELDRYLANRQTTPGTRGGQGVEGTNMDAAGTRAQRQRASKRARRPNSEADARALENGGAR
jgi:excisionase family DNA binding protein